jgi:uncharacterized membrane protein YidH (DUF202 family)
VADVEAFGDAADPTDGPGPPDGGVLDTGLQHERTALAWDRTALGLLVVGALTLRSAGAPFDALRHAPGYLTLVVGMGVLWAAGRRYRRREAELRAGVSPVHPRLVVITGVTTVAVSVMALVTILRG